MKISHKLILSFLIVATLASGTTFFALWSYKEIHTAFTELLDDPIQMVEALNGLKQSGIQIVSSTSELNFIHSEALRFGKTDPEEEEEVSQLIDSGHQSYRTSLERYRELVETIATDETEMLANLTTSGNELIKTSDEIIELNKRGVTGHERLGLREKFEEDELLFLKYVDEALEKESSEQAEGHASVNVTISNAKQRTMVVTGITFLVAIFLGVFISFSISRRIEKLKEASRKVGDGDLETTIDITSKDEIGDLSRAFNKMIGDLKVSRADINLQRQRMDTIVMNVPGVVWEAWGEPDASSQRTNFVSSYVETMLGYSIEEWTSTPNFWLTIVHPEDREHSGLRAAEDFAQGYATGPIIFRWITKDGRGLWIESNYVIVKDDDGQSVGVRGVSIDITERKEAEEKLKIFNEKLQRSNRELEDFAYVASHDLQEPLRKVQAFSDRLRTKYSDKLEGEGLDYLERMRSAASRMQLLIEGLLTFSRVSTKGQPFVATNLETITRDVLSDLEVKIEETGATFELKDLSTIDADPMQMRQLMQNLIGNALKFQQKGVAPIISIQGQQLVSNGNGAAGQLQLSVKDNGIGFDEKYIDKIFAVFQRLHGRADYEGSGVGLSICRKIAERHNGDITAHSLTGDGATFIVTLPLNQPTPEMN